MKTLAGLLKVEESWFPEVDDWATDEDFLLLVAQHILDNNCQNVIECGSGLSTLVIARCLELNKSQVPALSMEHKLEYCNRTYRWLEERKLSQYAKVRHFELGGTPPFYKYLFSMDRVDVLVVDGPPASEHPMSRYRAKDLFKNLAPGGTVFLDDADRESEKLVRDIWIAECREMEFSYYETGHGALVLKKKATLPRVLVTVPHQGWMHVELFPQLNKIANDNRFDVTVDFPENRPVELSYTKSSIKLIEDGYDWWLNIDDDNPPYKNPLNLINLDKDIIGCPTIIWRPGNLERPFQYNVFEHCPEAMEDGSDGFKPWQNQNGLQKVGAIGMGCTLVSRRVFENENMRKQPFCRIFHEDGLIHRGTDIAFCDRARDNGFEIWAHFDYQCLHYKEVEITEAISIVGQVAEKDIMASMKSR